MIFDLNPNSFVDDAVHDFHVFSGQQRCSGDRRSKVSNYYFQFLQKCVAESTADWACYRLVCLKSEKGQNKIYFQTICTESELEQWSSYMTKTTFLPPGPAAARAWFSWAALFPPKKGWFRLKLLWTKNHLTFFFTIRNYNVIILPIKSKREKYTNNSTTWLGCVTGSLHLRLSTVFFLKLPFFKFLKSSMLSLWLIVVEWDERIFKKLTKKAFEKLKSKNRWDLAPTCLDISAPTLLKSTRRFCLYCKYFRITFGLRIANIQGCRSQWAGGT